MILTAPTRELLDRIAFRADGDPAWWHDLPHPERAALLRRGLIEGHQGAKCTTHGRECPGYVRVTEAGWQIARS